MRVPGQSLFNDGKQTLLNWIMDVPEFNISVSQVSSQIKSMLLIKQKFVTESS